MQSVYPIPRKFKQEQEITMNDLRWGLQFAARLVTIDPRTLPLFQRLEREVGEMEKKMDAIKRAKDLALNG